MFITALLSFVAGVLTVLAPCILPLLPVILGGSFNANYKDKKRPYIIIGSLLVSLVLFTLLLRASTILIGIEPSVWAYISGGLVIAIGIFMLFPALWPQIISRVGLEHKSQAYLSSAYTHKSSTVSAVLIGFALGPVFSSCSPMYAWVIATVVPANAVLGVVYLTLYCLGLAVALLAIAVFGRSLLQRFTWASNPSGWFQRSIAVLFIVVGILIIAGLDKSVQTWFVQRDYLNLINIEQQLVPDDF